MAATDWLVTLENDVESRLSHLPMLLTWGIHDPIFTRSFLDRFRMVFQNARVQRLDAKHFIQEDAPKEISHAIEVFLRDNPASSAA